MNKYEWMTKAELLDVIAHLEKSAAAEEDAAAEHARLLNDLQVHQAELEVQNEELRHVRGLLEESRDRYADLYDRAPAGYLTLDARGQIQDINLRGAALLGQERGNVTGMWLRQYAQPDEMRRLSEYIRECFSKEGTVTTELRMNVPGRPELIVQLVGVVYETYPAREALVRITMLDITDQKRAEARVQELVAALERRSQELEAANREVNIAQRDLSSLVYSVSHDLNVPLTQMEQLAGALIEDHAETLDAEERQVGELIRANARRAKQLADALFVLSRLDQQPIRKQAVDMRATVEQVMQELRDEEPDRAAEFCVGDLPPVHADPGLMKQLWSNLICNAWKFTVRQPAPQIQIGSRDEAGQIVYFVKDNGAGFDMAEAGRLFRAFQRLHHDDDFPGVGLGLAIVERIVRRHGGRAWANAKVDKGATFYFTIGG